MRSRLWLLHLRKPNLIVVLLFIIVSYSEEKPEKGLDYLIVLGSQVKPDGPSRVLKYRLDRAEKYLKENPSTICIVSGGRGTNELQSEASAMKQYLVEADSDPFYKPNNYLREVLAFIKDSLF